MTASFELHTPRLRLRRLTAEHLDDLVALDSDPEVMRYISGGKATTRDTYVEQLLPRMTCYDADPFGFAAAYLEARFVGWFHLRPSVADQTVLEVGYRLRREVWGIGLATEGSRELIRYAFGELDRECVDACADPRNAASIRVLVKCGMKPAGRFMHPRIPLEVVRYIVHRG